MIQNYKINHKINICFNLIILVSLLIFSNAFAQQEVREQNTTHHNMVNNKIYIFVSFSMPDSALKSYFLESNKIGAVLVMRGLKNNSFLDTKAKTDQLGISINIDPELFTKYQITSVPVIVIDNHQGKVKKLAGHIALNDALQIMQEEPM